MSDRFEEPPPPLTAAKVAQDYFKDELESQSAAGATKTVIVVHDACYGHRYSRPRTTKAVLSTIVERPERIRAGVLGLSTAYIRLGQRHENGKHAPKHGQKSTAKPPFKLHKTARTISLSSAAATHIHGQRWMDELGVMCDTAESKLAANGKELARPEGMDEGEDGTPRPKFHEGDLYLCSESRDALEGCLGGVCEGIDQVFDSSETRRAFVCIRPPGHHCSADFPAGFCWLNNVHVGITHAAMTHGLTHAAIIDFDLHHGDGSQAIAWDHNSRAGSLPKNAAPYKKTPIGYYSLHDINSYPCEFGDEEKVRNASLCIENAHGQSIWNVHLEPWKTHQDFWKLYESRYAVLLDKARIFLRHHTTRLNAATNGPKPKGAIFISAGFDASEWEGAGMQRHKVNVPTDFYARFTADIVRLSEEDGLGVEGRVISVLEGGYSDRALTSGILSHVCGLTCGSKAAQMITDPMSIDMKMQDLQLDNTSTEPIVEEDLKLDMDWWAPHNLEALEAQVNRGEAPPPPKKLKEITPGNYSSPTHASTSRSVSGTYRDRRSFSGEVGIARQLEVKSEQPPPEVDWVTAAVELSRLLIPSTRTTTSCRHDELNAEATKARKARQSGVGFAASEGMTNGDSEKKMQLRGRKAKAPIEEEVPEKAVSKSNRRKTIAAVHELEEGQSDQKMEGQQLNGEEAPSRSQRRVSDASSIISGFGNMQLDDKSEASGSRPQSRDFSAMPENIRAPPPKAPIVKKARPAPTATSRVKPPTNGRTSPKRQAATPPVPQVPTFHLNGSSTTAPLRRPSQPPIMTTTNMRAATPSNVDELASSVGKLKINLKVPTPEENATRERERVKTQQVKEKKPRAPRKPPVPKATKGVASKKAPTDVVSPINPASAESPAQAPLAKSQPQDAAAGTDHVVSPLSVPGIDVPASQPPLKDSVHTPLPVSTQEQARTAAALPPIGAVMDQRKSLPGQSVPQDIKQANQSQATEMVLPEQRRGPSIADLVNPISTEMPTQQTSITATPIDPALQQMPPPSTARPTLPQQSTQSTNPQPLISPPLNTPPSVKRSRADLPIFTSSSPIPFGKAPQANNLAGNTVTQPRAGSLPSTNHHHQSAASNLQRPTVPKKEPTSGENDSIWDMPDSPWH